jgi:hypothetical protein
MIFKIILYLFIAFSILNGWWLLALPLLIVGIWKFSFKAEILIAGIIYDALFGMIPGTGLHGYIGTITAIFILIILGLFKKLVR